MPTPKTIHWKHWHGHGHLWGTRPHPAMLKPEGTSIFRSNQKRCKNLSAGFSLVTLDKEFVVWATCKYLQEMATTPEAEKIIHEAITALLANLEAEYRRGGNTPVPLGEGTRP